MKAVLFKALLSTSRRLTAVSRIQSEIVSPTESKDVRRLRVGGRCLRL